MIKQRLDKLEQNAPTSSLVILRTSYSGGKITGYRLNTGEQLTVHTNETSEAFRARACATATAQSNGLSVIRATYEASPCQP